MNMSRYIGWIVVFAWACAAGTLAAEGGGWSGVFELYGGAQRHVPERISGTTTAGVRFSVGGSFTGVRACCPSYGNDVGALTLAVYPWAGDVAASRARGARASRRFIDFADNARLKLDFAPLPAGEYYAELAGGTELVGVWKSPENVRDATSYLNGVRVEGSYEFSVLRSDCAVPFTGDAELYAHLTAPSLAPPAAPAFDGLDLYADTWDAMDGLGRVLGDAATLPAPRPREVGIFYWTWHQSAEVAQFGPYNNAEILAADPTRADRPEDPAWGPKYRRHHWDKPLFGYYRTTDAWVSRRHAQLLAEAGVDVVVFDATNGEWTWMDSLWTLARTWSAMRGDGMKTPQFAYMLPFPGNPIQAKSILQLYRDLYRPGKYQALWYYWKGRPLIHADPRVVQQAAQDPKASAEDRKDWLEILRFFTFRPLQPAYTRGPDTPDEWCWLEVYPQHGYLRQPNGRYEFCAAGVAQNHSWLKENGGRGLAAMNDRNVFGRAYVGPSEAELKPGETLRFAPDRNPRRDEPNRFLWGDNFAQQLDHALALDPDYLFVTGWNEWIANMFPEWMGRKNAFPDQYAPPFSRDIEPSDGVLKDHFYHQLVQGVRRFKGVRPQRRAHERPVYRDYRGDTTPRDEPGYGPKIRYRNDSGRNDLVECFVEHDATTLVFRVRCAAPITPHTDPRWMRLFLSCGLVADDPRANWEHLHFVVNRVSPPDAHTAVLESCTGGWNWKEIARVPMTVAGDTLTLKIPRAAIGQIGKIDVRFKWADNAPGDAGDVLDFHRLGDAAPDARFLYRYFE